jgi:DNA gyrase subunit A
MKEVVDVKDLTGLQGQLIEIRCRKNTDMEMVLNKLYKLTPLESSFSSNMNVLIDDLPQVAGVWTIVDKWIIWRRQCIVQGLQYDINKMEKQLHLLKGLEKVLLDIDTTIEIIVDTA